MQIDETLLRELLGKPRHGWREEIAERTDKPGVATGLAWTPVAARCSSSRRRACPAARASSTPASWAR